MDQTLRSELVGTAGLTLASVVALLLTMWRTPASSRGAGRRTTANVFAVLVMVQALHFAEEHATHFYEAFPTALGLAPWPPRFFLTFNLTWLAIWTIAVFGVRAGSRLAFFPGWFLAIASIANGVAHPLLAMRVQGYFPGLLTSPLLGIGGVVLWRTLISRTETASVGRWIPGRRHHFIEETEVTEGTV